MQHVIHILRSLKEESELMSIWMKPQGCRICDMRKIERLEERTTVQYSWKHIINMLLPSMFALNTCWTQTLNNTSLTSFIQYYNRLQFSNTGSHRSQVTSGGLHESNTC